MSADNSDNKSFSQTNNLAGGSGSFQINSYIAANPNSTIVDDRSMVGLFHKHGSYLQFIGGDGLFNTKADFHYNIGGNITYSVLGDSQFTTLGQSHTMASTGGAHIQTDLSPEAIAAHTAHQQSLDKIQKAKMDAFSGSTKKVPCPVCNQKITNDKASAILDKLLGGLSNIWPPYMPFSYATFRKVIGGLIVPLLSIFTNKSSTKKGTCNHPNCDGNDVTVPDFDAATHAATSAIQGDPSIQDNEQKMAKQDVIGAQYHANFALKTGAVPSSVFPYAQHVNNANFPTAHETAGGPIAVVSNGNMAKVNYYLTPDHSPVGNIHLDATHSVDVTSGGNGTHLLSQGPVEIKAGHVEITSTQANVDIFAKGFAQLRGKQVIIDAKDNSGDGGVHINSDHVLTTGQLSVNGDLSVKGSLMMDGTVYAPNLVTKSMSMQSEPSASIQSVSHAPSWNSPPPFNANQQGTTRNIFSEALHAIKTGFDFITGELLTVTGLYNVVVRAINVTKLAVPLDNQGIPTAVAWAVNAVGFTPLMVAKESIATVTIPYGTSAGTFPVLFSNTFVDADLLPVYNGPHNHDNVSGMHTHQYSGPEITHCDTTAGFQAQRPSPAPQPTPPRGNGAGTSPADSGSMPISLCFGLGLGGGGGEGARNAAYGIQGEGDGFDGNNFVDAYPTYNPDGSLNPPPTLSPFRNC